MSDETEQDTGAEASGAGVDPAAVALALGGESREKADAFLEDQRSLIAIQKHHLTEQFKNLRLNIWEKRLGVLLRIATGIVGLIVAAGLAYLIWNAANSNELIVDSFSVPPDLAQKGITGEVLAGDLVDRISEMQTRFPNSVRAPQSYANNFGDNIRLEIPETGVSLSELDRFLREKLGNDTHISGALIQTSSGLKLTARVGASGSDSVQGTENDLDALVQRVAEAVYGRTQPYRYGVYLLNLSQNAEAAAVFQALAGSGSVSEQSWGYIGLALANENFQTVETNLRLDSRAEELDSDNALAANNVAVQELALGRPEQAMIHLRKVLALLSSNGQGHIRADPVTSMRVATQAYIDSTLGDYQDAAREQSSTLQSGRTGVESLSAVIAIDQILEHDVGAARTTMADPLPDTGGRAAGSALTNAQARIMINFSSQDWTGALREAMALDPLFMKYPYLRSPLPAPAM